MKILFFILLNLSISAHAQFVAPLIEKNTVSGMAYEEGHFHQQCQVYQDSAIIRQTEGGKTTTHIIPNKTQEDIISLITTARSEQFVSIALRLCDGPEIKIHAQDIDLYDSGSCERERTERIGPASMSLLLIVNNVCGDLVKN